MAEAVNETGVDDANDTSVDWQVNATWLCGSAGPLWDHSLSWDTGNTTIPGENDEKYIGARPT